MASTPEEFAGKLGRATTVVKRQQTRAITARALVTKQYILAAAVSTTRQARPNWVQFRVRGDVAAIRLRGGFAYLTELGSHLHPEGWEETPRTTTARRRRNAAKKGVTLIDSKALNTPYGPKASVMHPALRARHFWDAGLAASRKPGHKAYEKIVIDAFKTALR